MIHCQINSVINSLTLGGRAGYMGVPSILYGRPRGTSLQNRPLRAPPIPAACLTIVSHFLNSVDK